MTTKARTRFTETVRQRLIDNKLNGRKPDSIRGLAKVMGKGDPVRSETYKRSLFKWMAPGEPHPSPESRALVAVALGLERGALDEDDEEPEPMSLDEFLARRIDHYLKNAQSPPRDLAVVHGTGSDRNGD